MRTGKLAEPSLMRSVLRQLDTDPEKCKERYGTDSAVLPFAVGKEMVCTAVSEVPGFQDRPDLLIPATVNNLSAAGAKPEALVLTVLLPKEYEEPALRKDIQRIKAAADRAGIQIAGGHTQVTASVTRPVYCGTGIGSSAPGRSAALAKLTPGLELVITKWIALAGTAALAIRFEEELKKRYPFLLIDRAKEFEKLISVAPEARAASRFSPCVMHDLSQGGIFGALWEMAERAGVGLEVDLKKIPVKQETIEICEFFDINPYNLYSAGSMLIGTDRAEAMVRALAEAGIPAATIGRVTDGNDRMIRNGEDVRYLDRPQQDEWYRRIEK